MIRLRLPEPQARLVATLRDPASARGLSAESWNGLLRHAYNAVLLPRLAFQFEAMGIVPELPSKVQRRLVAARHYGAFNAANLRAEIRYLKQAFEAFDAPCVFLKGAAYRLCELELSRGRISSDVDILVPRDRLDDVEALMLEHGWKFSQIDDYDERYYREWAHELPPLGHPHRHMLVDIHHTIAPVTSRIKPRADLLLAGAVEASGGGFVLGPEDMVVHAAVHLVYDDMARRLRDIVDMHDLVTYFATAEGFWERLLKRAGEHDAERALFYMLRYSEALLGTSVPGDVMAEAACAGPGRVTRTIMDYCVPKAVLPENPDKPRRRTALARFLLYIRSHWLRMPPHILIPHLLRKGLLSAGVMTSGGAK